MPANVHEGLFTILLSQKREKHMPVRCWSRWMTRKPDRSCIARERVLKTLIGSLLD